MDFKTLINQGIAKYIKINYKIIENFTKLIELFLNSLVKYFS